VPYHVVLTMMKAPEIPPVTKGRIPVVIPDSTPITNGFVRGPGLERSAPGYIIYFQVLEEYPHFAGCE